MIPSDHNKLLSCQMHSFFRKGAYCGDPYVNQTQTNKVSTEEASFTSLPHTALLFLNIKGLTLEVGKLKVLIFIY